MVFHPICVRYHIPLKQGLRHLTGFRFSKLSSGQISYSIKTRIKTFLFCIGMSYMCIVRYHIPLKQGLRLSVFFIFCFLSIFVRYHIPLKQGLRRTKPTFKVKVVPKVRYHIPLKQGLRLFVMFFCRSLFSMSDIIFH